MDEELKPEPLMSGDPVPGSTFAGYRLEALRGRGGMGVVYRATDLSLERPVALKLIAPEFVLSDDFRKRFLRESRLAAALDHPNVVPIYDAGEAEGQLYLAMRYVEGEDLKAVLEYDATVTLDRALKICGQVADALDAAHARGLVHRDVKPSNVLLDERGHAYLADFGLTRRLAEQARGFDAGLSLGTPAYVAPEQIEGKEVDGRADQYSLACLLCECLTGKPPFPRSSQAAVLYAHLEEEPLTPPGLEHVIPKALAKEKQQRYESCTELVAAARVALEADLAPTAPRGPFVGHRRLGRGLISGSRLVGREADVSRVAELLRTESVRLITITGAGGVGKTRLAQAVANEVAEDFTDGVIFVPLDSLTDAGLVVPTVARAVGVRAREDEPLEGLEAALADQRALLVLDTFEQVAEAAPSLVELLTGCPALKIAATSRTRLRVTGEHEYPLAPLAEEAGIALFLERARALRPDLELSDESSHAVAEICARLDGLPLAIELAAARVKLLRPEAISERLERSLELLTSGHRDLPARQQTLRATIDWSYGLLDEIEQSLLRLLSVFVGGCTLPAAEAVCAADLDSLGSLVDKSLVLADGERYTMLDTIREYATDLLAESEDADDVRWAHTSHYLELAESAEPLLTAPDQRVWLDRLETEHGNLRAALRFSLDRQDSDTALRLGGSLWGFWLARGYLGEGRRWLEEALATEDRAATTVRAKALNGAGVLAHYQGAYAHAKRFCEESLKLYRQVGEERGVASALSGLALIARTRGDYATAQSMFEEALQIFRRLEDRQGVARTLDRYGIAMWFADNDELAAILIKEGLAEFRELEDVEGIGLSLLDLGFVALSQGDPAQALPLLEESLVICRELGDRRNIAKATYALGDSYAGRDRATARAFYEESLSLSVELGDRWISAISVEGLARIAIATGESEAAARLLGVADALREATGAIRSAYFQALYDGARTETRRRLGDDAFDSAWTAGRTLMLEQAPAVLGAPASTAPTSDRPGGLTAREIDVLRLVAEGLTDAEVADRLVVSLRTVHAHLRSIYRKLDIHSRSAATRYAVEHGLAGNSEAP